MEPQNNLITLKDGRQCLYLFKHHVREHDPEAPVEYKHVVVMSMDGGVDRYGSGMSFVCEQIDDDLIIH